MTKLRISTLLSATAMILLSAISTLGASVHSAQAGVSLAEVTSKNAESQVRRLIEPLLEKYCHDSCKLLAVNIEVDVATPDEIAPGFDEMMTVKETLLAPSSGRIKLLIDDKVGPISREKLKELLQQYLDTLDYSVRIDMQTAHFPQPLGSESRVAELRERIAKQFQNTINDLFAQFCPEQCMFADFAMQTSAVNPEEAQYGTPGEFYQENGVAIRIKDISGTILMDESLSPEEQRNIIEMAKLKTNPFKNVTLSGKSLRFPRPSRGLRGPNGEVYGNADRGPASAQSSQSSLSSESKSQSTHNSTQSSAETSTNKFDSTNKNDTTNRNETTTNEKLSNNTESKTDQRVDSKSNNTESNQKQERYERIEKIERVENGDAVQAELQKFKVYGLVFACSVLSLLIFIAMATFRPRFARAANAGGESTVHRVIQSLSTDPFMTATPAATRASEARESSPEERKSSISTRFEIDRLTDSLSSTFAQHPRVAKYVFSRILTEEGVETMAYYMDIFGESIVMDMLRDPTLQNDLNQLTEYYAKTTISMTEEEKLELLRSLYNRTVSGKVIVLGNRSSNLFEFLAEMDATQIEEMIRTETVTIKAIVLTQCDASKRSVIFSRLDEDLRMQLLSELSRIDYLPRDYIFNVSAALKRKRRENPKLNTDALPGSEVLVSLLERVAPVMQRQIVANLESSNPDSARAIKGKLVSIDTLRFLRDGQLLEVVLSLRHDELLQFLKGAPSDVRDTIYAKAPKELVSELEEELTSVPALSREGYLAVERKILNRVKVMTNDGLINLAETNERMFASSGRDGGFVGTGPVEAIEESTGSYPASVKKVSGW